MAEQYVSKFTIGDAALEVKDTVARNTATSASTNATNALNKVNELEKLSRVTVTYEAATENVTIKTTTHENA